MGSYRRCERESVMKKMVESRTRTRDCLIEADQFDRQAPLAWVNLLYMRRVLCKVTMMDVAPWQRDDEDD